MLGLAQVAVRARKPDTRSKSIPAPVKGWNVRDGLDGMEPEFAPVLDNWFPKTGFLEVRRGHASHATGVGSGAVETLAPYRPGNTVKLIAAGGGAIYDATTAGAAISLGSGFTNDRWQDTNFAGRLFLVNGADAPQVFDNATLAAAGFTGAGLTPADLIGVYAFKNRLFFIEENSASFWYAGLSAVTGGLTEFKLDEVHPEGGKLIAMGSLTHDGGTGPDDFAVYVMESGSVIIYAGTDPGDAANWSLVGIYNIGAPVGRRPVLKVGADLIVITADGYIPLLPFLRTDRSNRALAVSDNISGAVNDVVRDHAGTFGWQSVLYPRGNMALFNAPLIEGVNAVAHQHVINTVTGAWCRFTGQNAASLAVHADELYFGGTGGVVFKADTGLNDNGANIRSDGETAFNFLASRGRRKIVRMARAIIGSDADLTISIGVAVDFQDALPQFQAVIVTSEGAEWDVGTWDTAEWAGGLGIKNDWQTVGVIGTSVALRIRTQTSAQFVRWFSNDLVYALGGVL